MYDLLTWILLGLVVEVVATIVVFAAIRSERDDGSELRRLRAREFAPGAVA